MGGPSSDLPYLAVGVIQKVPVRGFVGPPVGDEEGAGLCGCCEAENQASRPVRQDVWNDKADVGLARILDPDHNLCRTKSRRVDVA